VHDSNILILRGHEVASLLAGRENELIEVTRLAYETHAAGGGSLPQSTFLHFPGQPRRRIIALPAYLGGGFEVAGAKWISSFPSNLSKGLDRASAVIILNSAQTGRPQAVIEGSIISSKRTAASAALAARSLQQGRQASRVGIIGCGPINFEIVRFLSASNPEMNELLLFDLDAARADRFKEACHKLSADISVRTVKGVSAALVDATLVSLATTAVQPHIKDLSVCASNSALLHISLRDLAPETLLSTDNVVDDVDHVCRAQTSLHLAEQLVGNRDFIRCTLADITSGRAAPRKDDDGIVVFSPFGLGILDIAVGQLVYELAQERRQGTIIQSFLPDPWS
jgi:ornithine cyclodeaminase